eukprot:5593537-Pleurochrysis_carterae.AAC.1
MQALGLAAPAPKGAPALTDTHRKCGRQALASKAATAETRKAGQEAEPAAAKEAAAKEAAAADDKAKLEQTASARAAVKAAEAGAGAQKRATTGVQPPAFAEGSITSALGLKGGPAGAIEAFEHLCKQSAPGAHKSELPC